VDIPGTWGLTAPDDSAAMWYAVAGFDREQIYQWLRDLDDEVAADWAVRSLVAKGPAVLPFVIERLAKSSHLEAQDPDPVFKVLREYGRRATGALPAILVYLGKCNPAQAVAVLELVSDLAPFAPKTVRGDIAKLPILNGPPPAGTSKQAWLSMCFELKKRVTVSVDMPIPDLIRTVEKNQVFSREVAALALELRGSEAGSAVPALLKTMRTPSSTTITTSGARQRCWPSLRETRGSTGSTSIDFATTKTSRCAWRPRECWASSASGLAARCSRWRRS
jgi:hypothetical protein